MKAALVTISTSRAAGVGRDRSGERLRDFAQRLGLQVAGQEVISDDRAGIEGRLCHWADVERCALVLTSGGTGLSPSDVTPEATRAVIEREIPGITLAMLLASREHTRHWMLSRALAGVRGSTLIVNFPGRPESIAQAGEAIAQAIPHALELIAGHEGGHRAHKALGRP